MDKHGLDIQNINKMEALRQSMKEFVSDLRHLEKAGGRILAAAIPGEPNTEVAAVAWLLQFLRTKLQALNAKQQDELKWEVTRFTLDGGQGLSDTAGWRMGALGFEYPPALDVLATLQSDCLVALYAYLTTGEGEFPKSEGVFRLVNGYRGENLSSGFYYMAHHLLSRYAARVKFCEGCSVIMLVGRKDQRFHSQSCQVATFFRKRRAEKKEEAKAQQAKPQASRLAKRRTRKAKGKGKA